MRSFPAEIEDEQLIKNIAQTITEADGEQNLNALFAEAHPDAVLAIVDKVDEQRVPGKQRLWVWGDAGFLE